MYEPHYEEESGGGGFVFGLLCGAALGAAIGLMFAPKAGSELRQTLYDSTGDIRKKATDAYGQATQTVNDYVAKGRRRAERGSRTAGVRQRPRISHRGQLRAGQTRGNGGDFSDSEAPASGVVRGGLRYRVTRS